MANIPFTVSARTARLIGRENVANAEGALIELVKNCYDADSENSIILIDKTNSSILIIDTGDGMDDKIISEQWMTIGTDDKLYNAITKSGRIKSGAKGIGRFALDRLGETCSMITFPKKETGKGYKWDVDWNKFEKKDKEGRNVKINEVFAEINDIENSNYFNQLKGNITNKKVISILDEINSEKPIINGTALFISILRDEWSDSNISKVFQTLELLNPPEGLSKIKIWLLSNEEPDKYGLVENEDFRDYDYKLVAKYTKNENFNIKIKIHRNEFDYNLIPKGLFSYEDMTEFPFDNKTFKEEEFEINRTFNEIIKGVTNENGIFQNIGDFEFTFYFLKNTLSTKDREKYYQKEFLGNRGQWIEKFGGIKLYRDDFRIRPYGEINTHSYDWLMLGERFGQNPAAFSRKGSRVRPNQVAGVIKFSRIDNHHLEDKSNREGIRESETFEFFKNLLKGLIKVQEDDRSTVAFNLNELYSDLNKEEEAIVESGSIADEENDENETQEDTKSKNKKLKKGVKARDKKLSEKEDELATSRAMASAGIMIASFSHEFHGIKNNLTSRIFLLKRKLHKVINEEDLNSKEDGITLSNEIDKLYRQDQKLKQWIDFAIGLTKKDRRKNKKINLVDYFTSFKPFGMPMPNRINTNGEYRYAFQGQEKDPETGKEAFQLRLWDGRIGRWLTTDPAGQYSSPYLGMGNNPINGVDPDGAVYNPVYTSDGTFRGYDINGVGGDGIIFDGDFKGGMDLSGFLDNGRAKFVADLNNLEMFRFAGKGLGHLNRENFLNQLDPSTVRQNIGGLTYPGGDNPTRFNGKADYSFIPDDLSEYPAIGHDRRYDVLGVAGASGLFTDTRSIGADYKFVGEELRIAATPYLPTITRIRAGVLGIGLGFSALPKTIYKLSSCPTISIGVSQIMTDYHISSMGVTNKPGN